MLDYFAGSGTTAHAVMRLNHKAGIGLKWLAVEASHNLEAMIVPRVKKVAFAVDWLKGRPIGNAGPCAFVRVQSFEQYDDSLESLDIEQAEGDTADLRFDDPALALRYRLDRASRGLYCAIERFGSPFGYQSRSLDGAQRNPGLRCKWLIPGMSARLHPDFAALHPGYGEAAANTCPIALDFKAVYAIADGQLLDGDLPPRQTRLVQAWMEIHREALDANWALAVSGQEPFRIPPLQ